MCNADPFNSEINISQIKHIKDGGLLISCQSSEKISKFKQAAQDKLSNSHEVQELNGLRPRVKIVGLSKGLDSDTICSVFRILL